MSSNKKCLIGEIDARDLPDLLLKAARVAQNVENVEMFEKDYQDSFVKRHLSGRLVTDCIAILAKNIYDLGCEQNRISKSICEAFDSLDEAAELSPERHEYVVGLSCEIVKSYLRIEVLCGLLEKACHESARSMVLNHCSSGIELNLDTDPDSN